jgi:hypothetical protein
MCITLDPTIQSFPLTQINILYSGETTYIDSIRNSKISDILIFIFRALNPHSSIKLTYIHTNICIGNTYSFLGIKIKLTSALFLLENIIN